MEESKRFVQRLRVPALYLLPLFLFLIIMLVLNLTSPLQAGPAGILLVFGLFYLFACSLFYIATHIVFKVWRLVKGVSPALERRTYYLVSVIALGPIFLIALNTLGELNIREVILVSLLVAIGCFYVLKRTRIE
ncbi:MAG: hypothetical protein ACREGJ_00225 [Candidatus Saccharimonadales bacterium]